MMRTYYYGAELIDSTEISRSSKRSDVLKRSVSMSKRSSYSCVMELFRLPRQAHDETNLTKASAGKAMMQELRQLSLMQVHRLIIALFPLILHLPTSPADLGDFTDATAAQMLQIPALLSG